METIIFALLLTMIAGFINGSFATPMKYMTRWEEENIWMVFSLWGFLILPWLTIFIMVPNAFDVIRAIPNSLLLTILLGGIGFGIGQITFALAFRHIGIGLAFVINISMGTSGSALIPMFWHKGLWGTSYSYIQLLGIFVFILAVCFGAAAGAARDKAKKSVTVTDTGSETRSIKPGMLMLGVFLAVIAGVGSVTQGVTYIWANPTVSGAAQNNFHTPELASTIITWVFIFSAAWIPYIIYFLYQTIQKKSFSKLAASGTQFYWLLTFCMGVGFWGSLIFFSQASNEIGGELAPTVAWPLFMVFIILTSNFWSWKSGEWKEAGPQAGKRMLTSLTLFVVAIIVFSFSSSLQPKISDKPDDGQHDIHYKFIKHDHYPTHKDR